jgi:hypothetical protein
MTRMSREFSLVLLGSGILTAGYFLAPSPEDELERKAEEQAAVRVGHDGEHARTTYYHGGHVVFFVHSPGYAGGSYGRSAASPTVSRSGFGGVGRSMGAGGGGA